MEASQHIDKPLTVQPPDDQVEAQKKTAFREGNMDNSEKLEGASDKENEAGEPIGHAADTDKEE